MSSSSRPASSASTFRSKRVRSGVERAAAELRPDGGGDAARAILTTDTRVKEAVAESDGFTVGGMAKGPA